MLIRSSFVVVLLLALPVGSLGAPLDFQFLNSELTFGANAHDSGWDGAIWRDGGWDSDIPLFLEAEPASLLEHRVFLDTAGSVVQSTYIYSGGLFHILGGGFDIAVPIEVFEVVVPESGGPLVQPTRTWRGFGGDVYFELRSTLLDAATAQALGIGPHILGGFGSTDMAYGRCGSLGDHSAAVRVACDGGTYLTLDVPEPAMLVLFGMTAMAAAVRLRWRRNRL